MSYNAEIISDSINPADVRITTFKLTYPRIIHSEMMTHRVFSRNSASSRAIPLSKMIKSVQENPFIPIAWQKPHKGMQGTEYNEYPYTEVYKSIWRTVRDLTISEIDKMSLTVTKQLCNRLLEPFMWHTVLVTATDWDNFFDLRCPRYHMEGSDKYYYSWKDLSKDFPHCENYQLLDRLKVNQSPADIHIQAIAELIWDAMNKSKPKKIKIGEWHIPFGDNMPVEIAQEDKIKVAIARCARISYQTLGDNPKIDYDSDIKLYERLLAEGHMSPFEHVAECANSISYYGNFKGWKQYRKLLE